MLRITFLLSLLTCHNGISLIHCFAPLNNVHHYRRTTGDIVKQRTNTVSKIKSNNIIPQHVSPIILNGGVGIAKTYSWNEEQYEIELKVSVPANTKSKDISFVAKPKSISLSLLGGDDEQMLLDGNRKFRGMIDTDGTFWSIADVDMIPTSSNTGEQQEQAREITITMEKFFVPPSDPFQVIEFDWGGIYPDDEDEIISKQYKEAETLDVREYAASLGVDIDNINMTMVDKSMFTSGLNMTRDTMDELKSKGFATEVTRQDDGKEFLSGMDGEETPFNSLGDNIGLDEMENAQIDGGRGGAGGGNDPIPFLDTPAPWQQSMPVEEARDIDPSNSENDPVSIGTKDKGDDDEDKAEVSNNNLSSDPIDKLTVKKLKEILRKENLKVSGNKEELQNRLKDHVQTMMEQKRKMSDWQ